MPEPNVFDLVVQPVPPQEPSSSHQAHRLCTYKSRLGTPCPRDAEPDALVCSVHGAKGAKATLAEIRRHAIQLGPMVVDQIEDILISSENDLAKVSAAKLWTEIAGMKDAPPMNAGLEEEELEAARRSLERKLEVVFSQLEKRRTA